MEQVAYTIIGILVYFVVYIMVGILTTGLWAMWARKKVGEFWEYTLSEGLRVYYPDFWCFIRFHNILYSVVYVGLWPIMIPLQTVTDTKVIRRVMFRGYHF